jgi:hypothetical protein
MRETAVERRLIKQVVAAGGLCYKWMPITKGLPDRVVILPGGRIFFIETKTEGGKVEPAQAAMHNKMRARGVEVEVLYTTRQVDEWVEAHRE